MWSAISRPACAIALRSGTQRSRSRAATPAARSITAPECTTTRTSTCRLPLRDQRLLALQDPPPPRDSGGVGRVHPSIAQPARAEGARLRVRCVRGVVDNAEVEVGLRHVDALADRITVGLADLVAGVEVGTRLHLHHRVAALVVEVEVVAILQECAAHGDRALVVEG